MPDELTTPGGGETARAAPTPPAPGPTPAAPPVETRLESRPPGSPQRRPSWLRAALWSLLILAAGVALGGVGYRLERSYLVRPPTVERTDGGLTLTARPGHELSGLGLAGSQLVWQDGASIEYLDTRDGDVRLLGPGPGMRTTWDPALSDRFAVWFEAERQVSVAARLVVYDPASGRRRTLAEVGSVRSYPAISGDLAVWCSAPMIGRPQILAARVGGDARLITVADGEGAPVVSGGLVVWARSWTGPFVAEEVVSGRTWPVAASLAPGRLTGMALSGRTLVWGQKGDGEASGVVSAVDVDGGGQQTIASGVTGLAGPSYDGRTAVWGEAAGAGGRVMARRLGSGAAFLVADTTGPVSEVAVSGDSVAWIEKTGGSWSIVVTGLPK